MKICQLPDGISLDANEYASSIENIQVSQSSSIEIKTSLLKQFSGQINWLVNQVRPDLAFDACALSNCITSDPDKAIKFSNKIVRKIRNQDLALFFPNALSVSTSSIVTFCDASFKNLANFGSQGGFISFLVDNSGNYCAIAWQSHKIRRIVKSTIAAESLAALDAAEMTVFLASVLKNIFGCVKVDCHIVCDNRSLVDAVHSTTNLEDKFLLLDVCVLRDMLESQAIAGFHWICSERQIADSLTKQGASHDKLIKILCDSKLAIDFETFTFS